MTTTNERQARSDTGQLPASTEQAIRTWASRVASRTIPDAKALELARLWDGRA